MISNRSLRGKNPPNSVDDNFGASRSYSSLITDMTYFIVFDFPSVTNYQIMWTCKILRVDRFIYPNKETRPAFSLFTTDVDLKN